MDYTRAAFLCSASLVGDRAGLGMPSSIVRGRKIVCRVTGRHEADVIDDGAVFQRDGTIVDVGSFADVSARHQADEVLGSCDHVVVPGFVNAHHHVGLTPLQLGSLDQPLELWWITRIGARDVDPYLDTLYSAFEMIESGVTTVQHIHGMVAAEPERCVEAARRVLKAYDDLGDAGLLFLRDPRAESSRV